MAENRFYKTTTLSGNVVLFAKASMERLIIISSDGKTILRGMLGDAARQYWNKVSAGKDIAQCDWGAHLSRIQDLFPGLKDEFKGEIPPKQLWFVKINDALVENPGYGNACADRYKFYRVTNMRQVESNRPRNGHIDGDYELILIFFHVLSSGKLNRVMRIWREGKDESLPPSGYVACLIERLRKDLNL